MPAATPVRQRKAMEIPTSTLDAEIRRAAKSWDAAGNRLAFFAKRRPLAHSGR
jgi:hypothetical protein